MAVSPLTDCKNPTSDSLVDEMHLMKVITVATLSHGDVMQT